VWAQRSSCKRRKQHFEKIVRVCVKVSALPGAVEYPTACEDQYAGHAGTYDPPVPSETLNAGHRDKGNTQQLRHNGDSTRNGSDLRIVHRHIPPVPIRIQDSRNTIEGYRTKYPIFSMKPCRQYYTSYEAVLLQHHTSAWYTSRKAHICYD